MPPTIASTPRLAPAWATRRWAALLPQIVEGEPLACPTCRGPMRIIAFITLGSAIDQILGPSAPEPPASRTPGRGAPGRPHEPGRGTRPKSAR